jgi:hypothetical protein
LKEKELERERRIARNRAINDIAHELGEDSLKCTEAAVTAKAWGLDDVGHDFELMSKILAKASSNVWRKISVGETETTNVTTK